MERRRGLEYQPFRDHEPGVVVAPSSVHGLGVFTTRRFRKGDVVCKYSGVCLSNAHVWVTGTRHRHACKYRLECVDRKTGKHWFLDSTDRKNYCGRYINDARYTGYDWNVGFSDYISQDVDPISQNYWIEVFALCDLPRGVELFVDYGDAYWNAIQDQMVPLEVYEKLIE